MAGMLAPWKVDKKVDHWVAKMAGMMVVKLVGG